jgi:hypothetical protein
VGTKSCARRSETRSKLASSLRALAVNFTSVLAGIE